jgi:hypothetical protein
MITLDNIFEIINEYGTGTQFTVVYLEICWYYG